MPEETADPEVLVDRLTAELTTDPDSEANVERFEQLHPADQAEVLFDLGEDQRQDLLEALAPSAVADILPELDEEELEDVGEDMDPERLASILDLTPADTAADALQAVAPSLAQATLSRMRTASQVRPLLEYDESTAGGLMLPNVLALQQSMPVFQALRFLRRANPSAEMAYYLYVVDPDERLMGVVNLRDLVTAEPSTLLRDLMDDHVVSVPLGTDQERCARLLQRYNLLALPVVDNDGRLVGAITVDEILDVAEEEATEDMYRMVGVGEDERALGPLPGSVRRRLPWLMINLATAFAAASVVALFEGTIEQIAVLAVFMPIIAGQGGVATSQGVTVIVRSLALGEVSLADGWNVVVRELALGVFHGLLLGMATGVIALLWQGDATLGLIVGAAMMANIAAAGLAAAAVPMVLKLLRIDPALAATVIVTTVTDMFGFFAFLGLATLVLLNRAG